MHFSLSLYIYIYIYFFCFFLSPSRVAIHSLSDLKPGLGIPTSFPCASLCPWGGQQTKKSSSSAN